MKAIAAMSRHRVIGRAGAVPWHLPEELRWFKRATLGQVVLMGRRTFESLGGRPLPERLNVVVTRQPAFAAPGVTVVSELDEFRPDDYAPREVWVIGGAEVYGQTLPRCTDLYLTVVDREEAGDTFFPAFEDDFSFTEVVLSEQEFEVRHYRRRTRAGN